MNEAEATKLVDELFASWYSALVHYAVRSTGHLELAEDLVQQVFMLLYKDLRAGKEIENPKGWTLCVLRREIHKQVRIHSKESLEPIEALDMLTSGEDAGSHRVDSEDLTRLFSVLTRREEEVILLRLQSLKYREIAGQLGISTKSVNTLLARALRKLQQAASRKPAKCAIANEAEPYAAKTLQ